MSCQDCADKLGIHEKVLTEVFAEYDRQGSGGKLQPSTIMLKSMLEAKLRGAVGSQKTEIRAQILEVMAAALRLAENL